MSFRRPFAHGLLDRPDAHLHRNAITADEPDLGGDAWTAHWKAEQICSWSACAGWPSWEGPFVAWAEANGYELDYAVNADLEERPAMVDGYPLVLSVGHDEYWSSPMRDTIEAYIAGGGNVAFLSGNTAFWQVRLEDGGDTMVGYKDSGPPPRPAPQDRPDAAHLDVVRPDHRPAGEPDDRRVVHSRRLRPHRRWHAAWPARATPSGDPSTGCSTAPTCATATCSAPTTPWWVTSATGAS